MALDERVPAITLMSHALSKGLMPLIRGSIVKLGFRASGRLTFIASGVSILAPGMLVVGKNFYLGKCCYLDCLSVGGVQIGDNVTIREFGWMQISSGYAQLGDAVRIGSRNYFGPRCIIGASAAIVIGDDNQFGANLSLIAENHNFDDKEKISSQGVSRRGITIGDGCWFGNNVTILDGVSIGDGVVIGAGSVVTKSLPAGAVAYGVPARVKRSRN